MMRSTVIRHELAVGTFIVLALVGAGLLAVLRTRERGLIGARSFSVVVDHGSGLVAGAPVLVRGIQVGEVSDIQLTDDDRVRVTCEVAPRFAGRIRADAKATVVEPTLLGSTKVELVPGSGEQLTPGQDVAAGAKQGSLGEQLKEIQGRVDGVVSQVEGFMGNANRTLDGIQRVVSRIDKGEGLAGRLITDPALADDLTAAMKAGRNVVDAIDRGDGLLGAAVKDPQLSADVKATVASVQSITASIDRGDGTLGKLLVDPTLADETAGLMKDVRGAVARLDELNVEARRLLEASTKTVASVEGILGNADRLAGELADTVHRVNHGEGTIAALLNDPLLYKETKSLMKELRESVEDLREQAPINSFLGVVFSAF